MARVQRFVRDSIIEPVLTRDILSLRPVLNTALLRQVLTISLSLPCEEISFSKFAGQLSERGSAVTIKSYLELLEKAFLLKLLPRYSRGVVRKRTSSPKIVPLAPALVHAFKDPLLVQNDSTWFGPLFEMAVISRLSELPFELYYWSNSREDVDLVLDDGTKPVAVAIRSNERSEWRGLRAFKRMYPDAALAQVDRGTGEQLLRAESPMDYLKEIIIPSTAEIWRS
jgi:predicted AAA+ superfamily ATPase